MDKQFIKQVNRCIEKIAAGNSSGLEDLFKLTKRYLYAVALSYLTDKSKAEDILSDTYLIPYNGYG